MSEPTRGPWRACTDPNGVPQLLYSGLIAPIFYSPDQYVAVVSDTASAPPPTAEQGVEDGGL